MPAPLVSQRVCFSDFELDLRSGELRRDGTRIRLQEQPLLILQALLESPGQIVTRDELRSKIWPADTYVDFDHGLHAAVNRLRVALNDSADRPRYVETVARRGYRFIGKIERPEPSPEPPTTPPKPRPATGWNPWTGVLTGFGIAICMATILVATNFHGLKTWLLGGSPHKSFRSLAVLPLANLSGDAKQDYFADEMTEELINQFSRLGNLRVISRTSAMRYRGSKKSLPQIASELHVDAVVEGAVQLAGSHVRVTAQLVNGMTDTPIWGETYDRELRDVLLLQSEVAKEIANQIDLRLTPQQQERLRSAAHPVNPDAYQAYLLGRYYWNSRTADGLDKAGKYFSDAIQLDPSLALAYSGQADYFAFLTVLGGPEILAPREAMAKARNAASKALLLDDSLAEAHTSMANILHNYDWDWSAAEREFKRAIELNPNYATAHHLYAHLLIESGRTQESLAEARRALELDPYSPFVNNGVARLYYLSGQYEKSIAQRQLGLQINPNYLPARIQLALDYEQTGRIGQAVSELEAAEKSLLNASGDRRTTTIDPPVLHALLGHAYATVGRRPEAMNELAKLQATAGHRYIPSAYFAILWMGLGDKKQALAWLNRAYQERSEHMLYLGVEPIIEPLRADPRFQVLVRDVGIKR